MAFMLPVLKMVGANMAFNLAPEIYGGLKNVLGNLANRKDKLGDVARYVSNTGSQLKQDFKDTFKALYQAPEKQNRGIRFLNRIGKSLVQSLPLALQEDAEEVLEQKLDEARGFLNSGQEINEDNVDQEAFQNYIIQQTYAKQHDQNNEVEKMMEEIPQPPQHYQSEFIDNRNQGFELDTAQNREMYNNENDAYMDTEQFNKQQIKSKNLTHYFTPSEVSRINQINKLPYEQSSSKYLGEKQQIKDTFLNEEYNNNLVYDKQFQSYLNDRVQYGDMN